MAKNSAILDPKAKKAAIAEAKKAVADLKGVIKGNLAVLKQADKDKKANLKTVEDAYKADTAEAVKSNVSAQKLLLKAEAQLAELTAAV